MNENAAWRLEDFVDSLVVELDKTRETLAIKAINKPLSYSVKEVALDVNAFPSFDGTHVRFLAAQPGQDGASKLTIQLNSITDQQVRATTKIREGQAGPSMEHIDVDEQTRTRLRRIGVNSVDDLEALKERQVDLRAATDSDIDYAELARRIRKARRHRNAPAVDSIGLSTLKGKPTLVLEGRSLATDPAFPPVAVVNGRLADVLSAGEDHLSLDLSDTSPLGPENEIVVTCDPYAVVRVQVRT